MYIILAIIAFGLLIAVHEFGHFIFAKLFGVKVNEFAIGMGPQLLKKQGKETLYTLRLLPIGGYCAMEGEDETSEDPRAFTSQRLIKRVVILAAGPIMNLLAGFLLVIILFSSAKAITTNVVALTADGFPRAGEDGILPGDEIYSINGERVYFASDFSMILSRDGDGLVDLVIRRDGKKLEYENFPLSLREYTEDDGTVSVRYGVTFTVMKADAASKLRASCWQVIDFVRMIKFGLADLIAGKAGVNDFSGPVGIVSTMNEAAKSAPTVIEALAEFAYICAFIAVNLAVMNLLPIPALDGGRIFLGIISWLITVIFGKRIDPKYEGIIHTVFLVLMLGFTVYVMVNDVIKVIHG